MIKLILKIIIILLIFGAGIYVGHFIIPNGCQECDICIVGDDINATYILNNIPNKTKWMESFQSTLDRAYDLKEYYSNESA